MFQAPTGSGGGLTVLLLQMAAIGLVFYFLILRPSGQARKKHAELLTNLKKGDEVMTSGGLIGKVRDIKEMQEELTAQINQVLTFFLVLLVPFTLNGFAVREAFFVSFLGQLGVGADEASEEERLSGHESRQRGELAKRS